MSRITENTVVTLYDVSGNIMAQWYGYKLPEWLGAALSKSYRGGQPVFANQNASMLYLIRWRENSDYVTYGYDLAVAVQMALIKNALIEE